MMVLATLLMLQAAAPARTPAPSWKLAERTNAAGIRSVSASVTGQDGLSRFVVKCDVAAEPIVSVQFIWPSPLGASVAKPVSISFDGGLAIIDDWNFPGSGAYIADADEVTRLTTMLVKAKQVAVSTTNGSNFTVQASFAGPPGDAAIRQVLGACGYTLGVVPPPPSAPLAGKTP